ncbi:MAG: hypothetical protein K2N36_00430 [Ruminiclostridium sp.]|nr:hypothetical protein [Ruminiclostridium sp.]
MKFFRIVSAVCAAALALSSACVGVGAEASQDKQPVTTAIFSGESRIEKSWTLGPQVQTANANGTFDPSEITKGGYFTVDYTGTKGKVYLAFAEWTTEKWASVNTPTSTVETEKGYTSTFSFEDCAKAYGSEDLSDIHAICAGTTDSKDETVITNISWTGYPASSDLGETALLFKGSASASAKDTNLTFFYTKHVGGDWDASAINKGSYFYVEYDGVKDGIYLAFLSASGSTDWVAVYPDETGVNQDGRYYSLFKYDNFAAKFGTNFQRLDQIQVYSATNEKVTLKRVAYFEGEGAPVDNTDGTWDRPDTGIAFIGDSIVQNALVAYRIDWNGILDRTDCVNYGIGGQTTKECAARIDELAKKNYSKVVMLCGINDIGRGHTNEQIAANYVTMFDALRKTNPDIEIYLISVLPTTPAFYTNAQDQIANLNKDLKALADKQKVTYVDCYSSFLGDNGYCKPELVSDGLHPNLDGYAVIADILNPLLGNDKTDKTDDEKDPVTDAATEAPADITTSDEADTTTEAETENTADNSGTDKTDPDNDEDKNVPTGVMISSLGAAVVCSVLTVVSKKRK